MIDNMMTATLPMPSLKECSFSQIIAFTDEALFEACGVRIAFTTRAGGASEGPYASLNFGSHVEDDQKRVLQNRTLLCDAFMSKDHRALEEILIVPNQVHGDRVLSIDASSSMLEIQDEAAAGADAVIVATPEIGALLCFADCVPLIIVLPTGRFAVVHAGWRGVENQIAVKALSLMLDQEQEESSDSYDRARLAAGANVYIGAYIHRECFETSCEVHEHFVSLFGNECSFDANHIDLGKALRVQLGRAGVDQSRICDLDICTVCNNDRFFSYRAQDGVAGRHGAFAIRAVR